MEQEKLTLVGTIQKIKFKANDNNFTIAQIEEEVYGDSVTIKGYMNIHEGYTYEFDGFFQYEAKYKSETFVVSDIRQKELSDQGLILFLSSDLFFGIGEKKATDIVKMYGEDTLSQIIEDHTILQKFKISFEMSQKIREEILKHEGYANLYRLLKNYNFSERHINQIYTHYKNENVVDMKQEMINNPYELLKVIDFLPFKLVDDLYLAFIENDEDQLRLEAIIVHIIDLYCYETGNTYIEDAIIQKQLMTGYNLEITNLADFYEKSSFLKERIFQNKDLYHPIELYEAEKFLFENINKRINMNIDEVATIHQNDLLIETIESDLKIQYSPEQKEAIINSNNYISILNGGPGTGKTTTIIGIIKYLKKINNLSDSDFALCAPTGRAAQKMSENTNLPAYTIHSLLGWDPHQNKFQKHEFNTLEQKVIIIDEFSMVDVKITEKLIKATKNSTKIIIVGDQEQLESIDAGDVLNDFLHFKNMPKAILKYIFRQEKGSTIPLLASRISEDQKIEFINTEDISFLNIETFQLGQSIQQIVKKCYTRGYNKMDIQVLYPMYSGIVGIDQINILLKENQKDKFVQYRDQQFYIGNKVMQTKNNTELKVFNGDIGEVKQIFNKREDGAVLEVEFFPKRKILYTREDLENLTLAYAISIHKSQGSEFDVVIMPIDERSVKMLNKKLIYTAITRAKKKLIILGNLNLMENALQNQTSTRRKTLLKQLTKAL